MRYMSAAAMGGHGRRVTEILHKLGACLAMHRVLGFGCMPLHGTMLRGVQSSHLFKTWRTCNKA